MRTPYYSLENHKSLYISLDILVRIPSRNNWTHRFEKQLDASSPKRFVRPSVKYVNDHKIIHTRVWTTLSTKRVLIAVMVRTLHWHIEKLWSDGAKLRKMIPKYKCFVPRTVPFVSKIKLWINQFWGMELHITRDHRITNSLHYNVTTLNLLANVLKTACQL